MTKNILALDLGTKCGWAFSSGVVISGVWDLKPSRFEGGGMRFVKFLEYLDKIHAVHDIDTVCFEEVRRHIGTDAAHVYGGLMGALTSWCEINQIPYEGVPVATIKKYWTGSGGANKQKMIEVAAARGYTVADDNEADAIALLHWKRGD